MGETPRYLWKKDWKVKYKGALVVDIYDMMRANVADESDVAVFFQACKDMEVLITLSDDIPEQYWKGMIAEIHSIVTDFKPIADEYLANRNKN